MVWLFPKVTWVIVGTSAVRNFASAWVALPRGSAMDRNHNWRLGNEAQNGTSPCPVCKAQAPLALIVSDIIEGVTYRIFTCDCGHNIWKDSHDAR